MSKNEPEIFDVHQAANTDYRVALALQDGRWTVLMRNDALKLAADLDFETETEARAQFRLVSRFPTSLGFS
jgi:hypothetical protein